LQTSCSLRLPVFPKDLASYYNRDAVFIVLGWFFMQALLALVPIGPIVHGQPLQGGRRLEYNCNGFSAFVVSMTGLAVLMYKGVDVTICSRLFTQLSVAAAVLSLVMSIVLYLYARTVSKSELAPHGASG
jgi:lamin-B receptor